MRGFNTELKVGMQAMIIGVSNQQNAHKIGKMVTIEGLADAGEVRDAWFTFQFAGSKLEKPLALVSGIGSSLGVLENHCVIQHKYLMPLPPLDDDNFETDASKSTEQPKETAKC